MPLSVILSGELLPEGGTGQGDGSRCCYTRKPAASGAMFSFFFGADHKFHLQSPAPAVREFLTSTAISVQPCSKEHRMVLGGRVFLRGRGEAVLACLKQADSGTRSEWRAGVIFDEPIGDCDGEYLGYRYFQCAPNHGLVVPLSDIHAAPWSEEVRAGCGLLSAVSSLTPLALSFQQPLVAHGVAQAGRASVGSTHASGALAPRKSRQFDFAFEVELADGITHIFKAPTFWEMQIWVFELSSNLLCVTPGMPAPAAAGTAPSISVLLTVPSSAEQRKDGDLTSDDTASVNFGARYTAITLPLPLLSGENSSNSSSQPALLSSASSGPPTPPLPSPKPSIHGAPNINTEALAAIAAAVLATGAPSTALSVPDAKPYEPPQLPPTQTSASQQSSQDRAESPLPQRHEMHGWHWGPISRDQAEHALRSAVASLRAANGLFLLREKSGSKDCTVISVVVDGIFSHVLINDLMARAGKNATGTPAIPANEKNLARMVEFLRSPRPDIGWNTALTSYLHAETTAIVPLPDRLTTRGSSSRARAAGANVKGLSPSTSEKLPADSAQPLSLPEFTATPPSLGHVATATAPQTPVSNLAFALPTITIVQSSVTVGLPTADADCTEI